MCGTSITEIQTYEIKLDNNNRRWRLTPPVAPKVMWSNYDCWPLVVYLFYMHRKENFKMIFQKVSSNANIFPSGAFWVTYHIENTLTFNLSITQYELELFLSHYVSVLIPHDKKHWASEKTNSKTKIPHALYLISCSEVNPLH